MSDAQHCNAEWIVLNAVRCHSSRDVNIMKEKLLSSGHTGTGRDGDGTGMGRDGTGTGTGTGWDGDGTGTGTGTGRGKIMTCIGTRSDNKDLSFVVR